MGNRFLRLPEFAPGGDHHDARSDIAMAAGLLFFMLSGRAPRLPVDHNGEHPHLVVPSTIRAGIKNDDRWSRLSRILTVAFQPNPRQRQRDAAEFRWQLDGLDNPDEEPMDELDRETARLSANWHIDGGPAGDGYYEGSSADGEALVESCSGRARQLAGIAVQAFNDRMGGGR